MLNLATKDIRPITKVTLGDSFIAKLTTNPATPQSLRDSQILLVNAKTKIQNGYKAYFVLEDDSISIGDFDVDNVFVLPNDQYYLSDGDVIRFDPRNLKLRSLYRRNSNFNSLLMTERCNNYCLMCSQPPKDIDDSYIINELLEAIPLFDKSTKEIGITGGEPTLLGDDLIKILKTCKNYLPYTVLHILSNGRNFADIEFARKIANVEHPDLMIGIPLYSDISNLHDYVVQADGAFDQTVRGIINLKKYNQQVEIRVVIHKQTYERLPELAEFITRNLLFVDHVALMGLEMTGFTKANIDDLWIDPIEYQSQLVQAVETLANFRMNVSVYNHQLCLLDKRLWTYNRKSISDWKNEYMAECEPCIKKEECGGFFSSASYRYSSNLKPFQQDVPI